MTARLAFVDTETTGLDPDLHEIWEVGLVMREPNGDEHEHKWFLPVDLGRADPVSLAIGRFHERYGKWPERELDDGTVIPAKSGQVSNLPRFAHQFAKWTRGSHLVGCVTSFDEERLRRLLKRNGGCPEWHYHVIDVENLAAGFIMGREIEYDTTTEEPRLKYGHSKLLVETAAPPWDSETLSRAVGVEPDEFDRHTALGDVRWAMAIYDAVMNP